jgi:hypothetical protein
MHLQAAGISTSTCSTLKSQSAAAESLRMTTAPHMMLAAVLRQHMVHTCLAGLHLLLLLLLLLCNGVGNYTAPRYVAA